MLEVGSVHSFNNVAKENYVGGEGELNRGPVQSAMVWKFPGLISFN